MDQLLRSSVEKEEIGLGKPFDLPAPKLIIMEDKNVNKEEIPTSDGRTSTDPAKPDPETLNTTDPQENMEGPVSSLIRGLGESVADDKEAPKDEKEDI